MFRPYLLARLYFNQGQLVPGPLNVVYCATKAYVLSFSQGIARELKDTGITVTALCPGVTLTGFQKRAGVEDVKLVRGRGTMTASEVAEIGYRALMKGKRVVVPGFRNKLMMFMTRFTPRNMVTAMSENMMSK